MANSFSGTVAAKSVDGCESRPFDTGWHSGGGVYVMPNQQVQHQRQHGQISGNSGLDTSDCNVSWTRGVEVTDPLIDRFDDVPIIRGPPIDFASSSVTANANVDPCVESLNSCPLSDLLNEEVPFSAQPEFQPLEPARPVYNNTVKSEPNNTFIPQTYNNQMPPGNNNFLPTTTTTLPIVTATTYHHTTITSLLDTSASALRAAGFPQPEYPTATASLQQNPYETRRHPYDYQPPPVPNRQHNTSDGAASSTTTQFTSLSPGYASFHQAPLPGPLTGVPSSSNTSNFQSLPSLNNSASFQTASDYYTPNRLQSQQHHQQQQFRNPQFAGYLLQQPSTSDQQNQSSFGPRPIRERFLSAPGGAFARMDQISSFFGSMSSGFNADFQNERSRSPYSRSSSVGVQSPWCPSPLQPALQMSNGVNPTTTGACYNPATDQANVLQFADLNAQNSYFWQYNTQSKQRGHRSHSVQDPYSFDEDFRDPIFANDSADNDNEGEPSNQQQLRHPGKARRGDGTDTTPNPTLLYYIGNLLTQLNSEINGMHQFQQQGDQQESLQQSIAGKVKHASGSSAESGLIPSNRREKNMLASRVCRLKRKAQHEANKIVMAGLKQESEAVLRSIAAVEEMLRERILSNRVGSSGNSGANSPAVSILQDFRAKIAPFSNSSVRCAGRSSEFVSDVLQRVAGGDSTGGLKGPTVATSEDVDSDNEALSQHNFLATLSANSRHPSGADLPALTKAGASTSTSTFSRKRHSSSHPRLMSSKAPVHEVMADARYNSSNNNFAM